MSRTTVLLRAGLILGLVMSCQPPLKPSAQKLTAVLVIVIDASASAATAKGQTIAELRCPEATAAIEQALTAPGLRQLDVLMLASGSQQTAYEPRVITPWRSFAPTARLFGKKLGVAEQRAHFLRELGTACRSSLQAQASSPVYFALVRALQSLSDHARDLSTGTEMPVAQSLVALTDLRENVHNGIRLRLREVSDALGRGKPYPKPSPLLPSLKQSGVRIHICGLSEFTQAAKSDAVAVSPTAIALVWKEVLEEASFDAACASKSMPQVTATTAERATP